MVSNDANGVGNQLASLSLNGNGHTGPEATNPPKKTYVPPHIREQASTRPPVHAPPVTGVTGVPPPRNDRWSGGPPSSYSPQPEGWGANPYARSGPRGGGGGYGRRNAEGSGRWVDGQHVIGAPAPHLERKLFGSPGDHVTSGINFDKYADIPVEATGNDVPPPITSFTAPMLDAHLLTNIELAGYKTPTPVQKYSVPIVAKSRDLMACAQTGSGKTGGFLFPILSASFTNGPITKTASAPPPPGAYSTRRAALPTGLILAPTRELASQIHDEARKFAYRSWVRPAVAYGGSDIGSQIQAINSGCDLLTATPGRLVDLIERNTVSLENVRYLVLDEADRMLDMGFEPQIRRIVEGENMPSVQERQTLMFSATFPREIQFLAKDFLKDYVFLSVGRVGSTSENITQKVEYVEDSDKQSVLLDILYTQVETDPSKSGLTLIFVETKRMADMLEMFLQRNSVPATSIHGDRTQRERERALDTFRTGRTPVMVATAVAARGLDIPNVTHVINYDLPSDIDDYVHRIGRTGRAGNTGHATSFFNRGNRGIARDLVEILKEANQKLPEWVESIAREAGSFGRGAGRGRARGGATRDFRSRQQYNAQPGGHAGGGGYGGYSAAPAYGGGGFGGPRGGGGAGGGGGGGGGYGGSYMGGNSYGNGGGQQSWW